MIGEIVEAESLGRGQSTDSYGDVDFFMYGEETVHKGNKKGPQVLTAKLNSKFLRCFINHASR